MTLGEIIILGFFLVCFGIGMSIYVRQWNWGICPKCGTQWHSVPIGEPDYMCVCDFEYVCHNCGYRQ